MGGITYLPFVRDSKLAPSDVKSTSSSSKSVSAPLPTPTAAVPPVPVTDDNDPLEVTISAKGEEIRVLKANKVCLSF